MNNLNKDNKQNTQKNFDSQKNTAPFKGETTLKGDWNQLRGKIQKTWGKINANDLDQTKGDIKKISSLVNKHYGESEDKVRERLSSFDSTGDTKQAFDKDDAKLAANRYNDSEDADLIDDDTREFNRDQNDDNKFH